MTETNDSTPKLGSHARWTPKLAKRFCPVSSVFLRNYHRLQPRPGVRGMNSTEAMLVIQILDYKWTSEAPFPSVKTLAQRMGISPRAVRAALQALEESGYVRREARGNGRTNQFHFDGLYLALERLLEQPLTAAAIDNLEQQGAA